MDKAFFESLTKAALLVKLNIKSLNYSNFETFSFLHNRTTYKSIF